MVIPTSHGEKIFLKGGGVYNLRDVDTLEEGISEDQIPTDTFRVVLIKVVAKRGVLSVQRHGDHLAKIQRMKWVFNSTIGM